MDKSNFTAAAVLIFIILIIFLPSHSYLSVYFPPPVKLIKLLLALLKERDLLVYLAVVYGTCTGLSLSATCRRIP